ncbi:hypothetical protein AHAS_Ahas15G0395200 [Arachis hypogaea]
MLQFMMGMEDGWLQNMHRSICMGMLSQLDYHLDVKAAKRAILDGFRKTDESLLQESSEGHLPRFLNYRFRYKGWQDGATAVSVWVLGQKVFVANIEDARAVLARSTISDGSQGWWCCKSNGRLQGRLKFLGVLETGSSKRWVVVQPQISILLILLRESISSFLAVMACGGYLVPVMLLILFRS